MGRTKKKLPESSRVLFCERLVERKRIFSVEHESDDVCRAIKRILFTHRGCWGPEQAAIASLHVRHTGAFIVGPAHMCEGTTDDNAVFSEFL
jgi:hypothetical protein